MATAAFGLQNTGVICYFNSLNQALISCPEFISAIKQHATDNSIAAEYNTFLPHVENGTATTVNPILQHIVASHEFFGRQQEDASEGFDLLLEKLGDNIAKACESKWRVDIYCDKCVAIVSNTTETMNRLIMERQYIALRGNKISDYMEAHMSQFSEYNCPKCQCKNVDGATAMRLMTPPKIYVVSFNKFMQKWADEKYPEEINIRYGPNMQSVKSYKLVAVVRHYGGMGGGHYDCIARRGEKTYQLNDSAVNEAPFEQTSNDYMLFYV